jgi:hypothetical protein
MCRKPRMARTRKMAPPTNAAMAPHRAKIDDPERKRLTHQA